MPQIHTALPGQSLLAPVYLPHRLPLHPHPRLHLHLHLHLHPSPQPPPSKPHRCPHLSLQPRGIRLRCQPLYPAYLPFRPLPRLRPLCPQPQHSVRRQ
ncbi:rCG52446, isoform CRA_a [Rattus norvegicus]|uniref:RCG52446, isoform CRA_a n=1 Tax=Rattus norvegicus TaxID=10116 RepID=A6K0V0_RAT|nr:rCG52446, isoform CRA_a [Rattus norvegicus]EDL88118.1 rCG52446, isoform CRA_a [Rattus norvegicus]